MSHMFRLGLSVAPFLFTSLFCLTASAQGQPANSPAASSALPPLPAAPPAPPAQTNAPAAAQPMAPPSGYGPPPAAAAPPQGYSPPPPQAGWGAPPPNYGPPPPPEEEKGSGGKNVSLTFSPLHLILPVFEATVEVRLHDHVGIAAIGGYGQVKASDIFQEYKFSVWEAGGQLLFYPISTFDKGLQLGAEALYVKVNTSDAYHGTAKVSGTGSGLAIGPLVGYKVCTSGGFTFVVQGGVQFMTAKAEASDSNGQTASDDDSNVIPLLNLNLGWSF